MRFLYVTAFVLFVHSFASAQVKTDYIQDEIKKVENFLSKQDAKLTLNNEQRSQLVKIFDEKKVRYEQILSLKKSKIEVSNDMTTLENEYKDRVESIMNVDQRLAYQKIKKSALLKDSKMN